MQCKATRSDGKPCAAQAQAGRETCFFHDPADLVNLCADTIDKVKTGKIDPRVANSVGYLAGVMVKILEYDALNERLAALEDAVGVGPGGCRT